MAGTLPHTVARRRNDTGSRPSVLQELCMLLPSQSDQYAQTILRCRIEKPPRWHGVRAHRVDAKTRHGGEVKRYRVTAGIFVALFVGAECAVSYAPNPQLFVSGEEELSAHLRPLGHQGFRYCTDSDRIADAWQCSVSKRLFNHGFFQPFVMGLCSH